MVEKYKTWARKLITVLVSANVFVVSKVYASPGVEVGVGFSNDTIQSGHNYSFAAYVQNLYAFSMKAAIALCTLMIIYAGYKYLTSRGDTSSLNEAKDILFSTLMGAALLMMVVFVASIANVPISIH